MPKHIPHRRKHRSAETVALPTADNAKWLGIGFLTAAITVVITTGIFITAHIH